MARKARASRPLQRWIVRDDGGNPALRFDLDGKHASVQHRSTNFTDSVFLFQAGANGAEQAGSWACRETFVAVVIGNVPMIYPLFRRLARRAGLYITTKSGTQSYPAYQLSDGDGSGYPKRKKFLHPLSLPADTQRNTVSDEQMILPTSRQQAPTCTAGEGDWETNSHASQCGGIKVVHEMIVHSAEKEQRL